MDEGEGEEGEDRLPLGRTGQPLDWDVDAPSEVIRKKEREGGRKGGKEGKFKAFWVLHSDGYNSFRLIHFFSLLLPFLLPPLFYSFRSRRPAWFSSKSWVGMRCLKKTGGLVPSSASSWTRPWREVEGGGEGREGELGWGEGRLQGQSNERSKPRQSTKTQTHPFMLLGSIFALKKSCSKTCQQQQKWGWGGKRRTKKAGASRGRARSISHHLEVHVPEPGGKNARTRTMQTKALVQSKPAPRTHAGKKHVLA